MIYGSCDWKKKISANKTLTLLISKFLNPGDLSSFWHQAAADYRVSVKGHITKGTWVIIAISSVLMTRPVAAMSKIWELRAKIFLTAEIVTIIKLQKVQLKSPSSFMSYTN